MSYPFASKPVAQRLERSLDVPELPLAGPAGPAPGPVALLRLSPRHERPAFQAALVLGLFLLGSTAGALFLPLVELLQKL